MTEATPEMALRIEADVRLRAGQITETQARGIVRAGKVDPLATMVAQQSLQAHSMASALRELHSVCLAMDAEDEAKRLTDAETAREARERQAEEDDAAEAFARPSVKRTVHEGWARPAVAAPFSVFTQGAAA